MPSRRMETFETAADLHAWLMEFGIFVPAHELRKILAAPIYKVKVWHVRDGWRCKFLRVGKGGN